MQKQIYDSSSMQCVLSAKVIFAYICKIETHALYVSYSQCDVYVIVTISHLYTIFPFCIYIASILNAMYMHLKQTHLYAIRPTTRYITHSKNRNWSKCDVHRILNCDIYRIYFLNAMYVASACGVLMSLCYMCPYPFFSGARARRQNSAKLNRPGFGCLSARGGFAQRWKSSL